MITLDVLPEFPYIFMMIFARIGVIFMFMPAIGDKLIPRRFRAVLAVTTTLVLYPLLEGYFRPVTNDMLSSVRGLGHEIAIGLLIGITTRLAAQSLQIAGVIIGQKIGLGFVTAVDPTQQEQSLVVSNFLVLVGAMLVLSADLHHLALAAVVQSYEVIPFHGVLPHEDAAQLAIKTVSGTFRLAIQMSAPFIVFALVVNVGLALVARVMPQMQIFFIGVPITITLGFVLLLATLGMMGTLYVDYVTAALQQFMAL